MRILLAVFLALPAHAADRGGVIDLGELKVKGDVRRPSTEFYQLKSLHDSQLLELSDLSFAEFEQRLLAIPLKEKRRE